MTVGCKCSIANSDKEDLENWHFVRDGFEKGVEAQLSCETAPGAPVGVAAGVSSRSDSTLYGFLSSAEITAEVRERVGAT